MKLTKLMTVAILCVSASAAMAEPKCAHKDNGLLTASTNPPIQIEKTKSSSTPAVQAHGVSAIR